jgi:hypothetical protein
VIPVLGLYIEQSTLNEDLTSWSSRTHDLETPLPVPLSSHRRYGLMPISKDQSGNNHIHAALAENKVDKGFFIGVEFKVVVLFTVGHLKQFTYGMHTLHTFHYTCVIHISCNL